MSVVSSVMTGSGGEDVPRRPEAGHEDGETRGGDEAEGDAKRRDEAAEGGEGDRTRGAGEGRRRRRPSLTRSLARSLNHSLTHSPTH